MDQVFVKGLKAEGVIGVFDWEREVRQALYVDLVMTTDIKQAAQTDNLADTLDYKAITDMVQAFIAQARYQLIETLAEKLADKIRSEFNVAWLTLTLHKPSAIADASDIGVSIERGIKP